MFESLKESIDENPLLLLLVFPLSIVLGSIVTYILYQADKHGDPEKIKKLNEAAKRS